MCRWQGDPSDARFVVSSWLRSQGIVPTRVAQALLPRPYGGAWAPGVPGAIASQLLMQGILESGADAPSGESTTTQAAAPTKDPWQTFYHGTDTLSAYAIASGSPLSVDAAVLLSNNDRGAAVGFYMSPDLDVAHFFANRHFGRESSQPGILRINISPEGMSELLAAGARLQDMRPGGLSIDVQEFFLPPSAFPVFDHLVLWGEVRLYSNVR